MNINPKDRRNYHHLSVEQKKVLFTAIHKAVDQFDLSYSRMFTEPRAKGYRTKLWHGRITDGYIHTIADRIYSEIKQTSMAYGFPMWRDIKLKHHQVIDVHHLVQHFTLNLISKK
jgi:hypothetical protein